MADPVTFVDTNVLVYAHDHSEAHRQPIAQDLLNALWQARTGVLSTQVLQEFYLVVEAARRGGATRLLTEDLQAGRRIGELRIENPFA
jgi:predicted nucleic acid-binding protein